jgi:hypothetical protein
LEDGSWVEDKEQTLKIKASYVISAFGSTLSDNEGGWCGRKETFLKFERNLRRPMCRTIHILETFSVVFPFLALWTNLESVPTKLFTTIFCLRESGQILYCYPHNFVDRCYCALE